MEIMTRPQKKLNKKIIGALLLAAMIVLIFFSRTLYAENLPLVTAALPKNGRLSKAEYVNGAVSWRDEERLYTELAGVVEEVLVREGDDVKAGQPLYRMSYDRDDIEAKIKEAGQTRSKLKLDIQSINLSIEKLKRQIEATEGEVYEATGQTDYEIRQLEIDIYNAQLTLRDTIDRFYEDEPAATENDILRAEANLASLQLKMSQLIETQKKQAVDELKELAEKEEQRARTLQDQQTELEGLQISLKAKNLDIKALDESVQEYEETLLEWESKLEIPAPVDGRVLTLDAQKGEKISANQAVASFGIGDAFTVTCSLSADNNFVAVGDEYKLINSSHSLTGRVTKLENLESHKAVTLEVSSAALTAGETLEAQFKKDSDTSYTLVPNGAVNKDNDGYFLYQIKRREGVMGQEYYVDRVGVTIGDADADNTVITRGVGFFEPIVVLSDTTLAAGATVRVDNEKDFFDA